MNVRGLIITLIIVSASLKLSLNYAKEDMWAYVIFGVVFGWGLDYMLTAIKEMIKKRSSKRKGRAKILDSSVIIDGRILDIIEADFLEGEIVIPRFVLEELQFLADSEDGLKRARGRRGLDLIKSIQNNKKNKVVLENKDYSTKEVDSKLVRLAKDKQADLVTTDFNLNKVATIQGVKVLNINQLSNALKPMVIPNEELEIELIKKGDRDGQAIGYLNDGTMVVAEDGGDYVTKTVILLVTSVYPTAAGRMIFGRIKK